LPSLSPSLPPYPLPCLRCLRTTCLQPRALAARFLSKALEYLAVVASVQPLSSHSASIAVSYFLRACAPPGSTDRLRKAPAPTPPTIQSLSSSHATLSSICAECGETRKELQHACCRMLLASCRMLLAANNSMGGRHALVATRLSNATVRV